MRTISRVFLLTFILVVFAPIGTAFAMPQCTPHDRLIQKINAAYNTQFPTHCNSPKAKKGTGH